MENYYKTLGLGNYSSFEKIRGKYLKLAKELHPDKATEDKEIKQMKYCELSEIYKFLQKEENKREYDMKLRGKYCI